jgi:hypothetical protein
MEYCWYQRAKLNPDQAVFLQCMEGALVQYNDCMDKANGGPADTPDIDDGGDASPKRDVATDVR